MLIDLSLNILKNYEPNSIVEKQKASLGFLHYLDPKKEVLVIRFGIRHYEEKTKHYNLITFKKSLLNLSTFSKFKQLLRHKNGVIICHGFGMPIRFMLLKLITKNRFRIYVQHHSDMPFQNFFKAYLQRSAYKNCDGYFFSSKELAKDLITAGIIPNKKVITELMEGSTNFTMKNKIECRKALGIKEEFVFLWVGRLNANKDPLTVLKAFEQFSKENTSACLYMIFGTDELKAELEQFIKEKQLENSVKLVGRVEHEKLEIWYSAVDVFVSASYYESSSYALCETLAGGCFPLLTTIPSFLWMTGNGKIGAFFSSGNSEELLKKLRELDRNKIENTREERRKHFEELLSFEAIAKTISNTINQKEK